MEPNKSTLWRSQRAFLTVFTILSSLVAMTSHAISLARDQFSLQISPNSDRSDALLLNGTGTRLDSEVAVFLDTTSSDPLLLQSVIFKINGQNFRQEHRAPYDLAGTLKGGDARLMSTDQVFEIGPNTITAVVQPWFSPPMTIEGTLEILATQQLLVELAASVPDLSILVEALIAANLVDVVSDPGPFTIFAPTDNAFTKLLGDLDLTKEELFANTNLLTTVLTYHILPNALFREAVLSRDQLVSLQGEPIKVDADAFRVNDSNLILVDMAGSNGVIHVIDSVLLPPSVVSLPSKSGKIACSFALTKTQSSDDKFLLKTVLPYHLGDDELFASDELGSDEIFPMEFECIEVDGDAAQLDGIDIITTDENAPNGVVHAIDGVLIPPAELQLFCD